MKTLSRDQLQARKEKAVRFVRDVLGDSERAAEIEEEGLEHYAERRKLHISNPQRTHRTMAFTRTKMQLQREIAALREENEELQNRLDDILEIAAPECDGDDGKEQDSDDTEEADEE